MTDVPANENLITGNLIGFPVFPQIMEEHCDRMWRERKQRAEKLYVLALLLARECRLRAKEADEEDTWTFDSLEISRCLLRAGATRANSKRNDYGKGKTAKTGNRAE